MRSQPSAVTGLIIAAGLILGGAGACTTRHIETTTVTPTPVTEQSSTPASAANEGRSPRPSPQAENPSTTPRVVAPVAESSAAQPVEAKPSLAGTPLPKRLESNPVPGVGIMEGPGSGGGPLDNPHPLRRSPVDYNAVFTGREVDRRAGVIEKPEPSYTATAKQHELTGTVILNTIFAANGQVTDITVVRGLPDGLTEAAVAAAKRVKFKPALINGRTVSMYMQLQYN